MKAIPIEIREKARRYNGEQREREATYLFPPPDGFAY
jgi:hypothetical protein